MAITFGGGQLCCQSGIRRLMATPLDRSVGDVSNATTVRLKYEVDRGRGGDK